MVIFHYSYSIYRCCFSKTAVVHIDCMIQLFFNVGI